MPIRTFMSEFLSRQFGLLVAYLLPGFIALLGLAPVAPPVAAWLRPVPLGDAGVGPTVYALLAAVTLGMIVSCARWLLVDHLHHATGLLPPKMNYSLLEKRLAALNYLVEGHYRYYQFYANTLVAVLLAYPIHRFYMTSASLGYGTDLGVLSVCAVLFAGSRDTLAKYYDRLGHLVAGKGGETVMTNGFHNDAGPAEAKAQPKAGQKQGAVQKPRPTAAKDTKGKK